MSDFRVPAAVALSLGSLACPSPDDAAPPAEQAGWCDVVPTTNPGLDPVPDAGSRLLQSGLRIDPDAVVCPDATYATFPPFVRRHTSDYTASERFGGFDDCVPLIDLQGFYDGVRITQTPLVTATYGLARYGDLLRGAFPDAGWTGDPVIAQECPDPVANVVQQAEWLDATAVSRPHDGVETWAWTYDFVNPAGELDAGWTSGYAQGLVAAAYVAAYCVSEDPRWLGGAEKALLNLLVPMADGGTGTWESDDAVWFEEAAAADARSARSLNGHLGALAAVWAVAQWTAGDDIAELVEYGTNAPLRELQKYDAGLISLYTQWSVPYPLIALKHDYNRFHVQQLSWLHGLTGDARAMESALRFARYDDTMWTAGLSPTHFGREDFWDNSADYFPQWWTPAPGWVQADLERTQTVDRVLLWSPDPSTVESGDPIRPASVTIGVSEDGESWTSFERPWTDGCNDVAFDIPPTEGRHVRVDLRAPPDQPYVGLQAFGVRRSAGHPTAVANWTAHSAINRPASAFTDEGFRYSRIGATTIDLHGAFPGGLRVELGGWRGPDDSPPMLPLPTIRTADDIDGPWSVSPVEPAMEDGALVWTFGAPAFRFLVLEIDTAFNPLEPGRLWIRGL